MVANGWDAEQLEDWGLDIPSFDSDEDLLGENITENEIFKISINVESEEKQEQLYQELIAKGYDCKRSN